MSALVHDSPDRAVTAIKPLTGSDKFATWKRLMTSYLEARQVWDMVSGDLQRPDCLFKYAKSITADMHPLVEPHLNGAVRQRAIEARLEVEVQAFERQREWSRREAEAYRTTFRYLSSHISIHVVGLERPGTSGMNSKNRTGGWNSPRFASYTRSFAKPLSSAAAVRANSLIVYGCSYID